MKSKLVLTVLACVLSPALISMTGCGSESSDPPANPGGTTSVAGGGTTSVAGGGTTSVAGGGTTSVAGGGTTGGGGSVGTVCDAPTLIFQVDSDVEGNVGCSGSICHTAANAATYPPDLVSPGVEARVKDVASTTMACSGGKYIDPANVENSLLLKKLTAAPGCGIQMPFAKAALTQDKIECIRSWVTAVAAQP
jgi:hypothetical protein